MLYFLVAFLFLGINRGLLLVKKTKSKTDSIIFDQLIPRDLFCKGLAIKDIETTPETLKEPESYFSN